MMDIVFPVLASAVACRRRAFCRGSRFCWAHRSSRRAEHVRSSSCSDFVLTFSSGVRAFASRAIRGRRLAYAVIAEPVDAEVDAARIEYRRIHCGVFERIIREGISVGEFPPQNAQASAACLVGAFMEGLVGPLAPESGSVDDKGRTLTDSIATFALRAVSGKEPHDDYPHG